MLVTLDQKGKKVTLPLMQNVQVMATGQRAVDGAKDGERKSFSTVTIDATPAQAENVIVARDAGRVTALLRNPDDKRRLKSGDTDMVALLGTADRANSAEQPIPVLYGGSARIAPDMLSMAPPPRA